MKNTQNQQKILSILVENDSLSSSDIHNQLTKTGQEISLVTIKRELGDLKEAGLLNSFGAGRSVKYSISSLGRLGLDIDVKKYCSVEPDRRYGLKQYNFDLFASLPKEIFTDSELIKLNNATEIYHSNIKSISDTLKEKELERFVIELSWKSSRIEGNTYTLLDTENLINKNILAPGHDKSEAIMILNHKEAFKFVREHTHLFKKLNPSDLEDVHKILVKDLNVNYGYRSKGVGVTGSIYRPLDNIHQIKEAITLLCDRINSMSSPYAKAMSILLGISYIQPFEDGNKRTSRIMANAILLAHGYSPLSYRSVDENEYREAVLVFYELNSIVSFKKIFIDQYIFASKNYAVK